MRQDREAGRFVASFSARADRRSGMLLPRYQDYENSAEVRRRPGDAPKSGLHRPRRYPSCRLRSGLEKSDRANLIGAARIGGAEVARDIDGGIEVLAVDDVEAEQLLLGLSIGTVQHQRRIVLAQRGRRGGRQQSSD